MTPSHHLLRNLWVSKVRLESQEKNKIKSTYLLPSLSVLSFLFCCLALAVSSRIKFGVRGSLWKSLASALQLETSKITMVVGCSGSTHKGGLSASALCAAAKACFRLRATTIVTALAQLLSRNLRKMNHAFWWHWVNLPCLHAYLSSANKIYIEGQQYDCNMVGRVACAAAFLRYNAFSALSSAETSVRPAVFSPSVLTLDSSLGLFKLAGQRGLI